MQQFVNITVMYVVKIMDFVFHARMKLDIIVWLTYVPAFHIMGKSTHLIALNVIRAAKLVIKNL